MASQTSPRFTEEMGEVRVAFLFGGFRAFPQIDISFPKNSYDAIVCHKLSGKKRYISIMTH